MSLRVRGRPHASLLLVLVLVLVLVLLGSAGALDVIQEPPELICSEGLADCHVSKASPYNAAPPYPAVTHVELHVILCCSDGQDCHACLRTVITLKDLDRGSNVSEESGESNDEESGEFVLPEPRMKVCLSSPGSIDSCKTLQFKPSYAPESMHELLLTEKVAFGSVVVVHVHSHHHQNITIPPLEEVCAMKLDGIVAECDAPTLQAEPDELRNVVLRVEDNYNRPDELMCQMFWNEMPGDVLAWPKGQRKMVISSNSVAPCLCFQVWWKGKSLRREFCPFRKQQDALKVMQRNVSVSMVASPASDGGSLLSWNVTSPCRLEAEVWLCKKEAAGGVCEEVAGSRQSLHSHTQAGWSATRKGHWKSGEFNMSSHPLLCVQMKISGMESYLGPQCPFETSRWRWSLLLLLGLLLMSLAVLGAYFVQGILKGYMWRWLKEDDVKGAVGGCHVVLLYPPDDQQALPGLMCHLGSSLQALGFSVSLDLWSRAELSVLGPVPWLHSRLDRLQRQGGKVVLVLTQAAWIRAEEWGAGGWERNGLEEKGGDQGAASPARADVFSSSLSCVLADYLQGRAGERFMLVQFESLPPEPPGGCRPLPELFRGLHVYSLPAQCLGFLTELAGARRTATASSRRKRAGGLRMASRALARRLASFSAGTTVLRLAGMSQTCVGAGGEDPGERMPLQPCLVTPPSSPDAGPKVCEMDWV